MPKPLLLAAAIVILVGVAALWFAVLAPQHRAAKIAQHSAAARAAVVQLNTHLESLQPQGDDAGDLLIAARDRYRELEQTHADAEGDVPTGESAFMVLGDLRLGEYNRPGLATTLAFVDRVEQSAVLDDIRRAAEAPRVMNRFDASRPPGDQLVDRRIGSVHSLASFEVARMRIAAETGQADKLAAAFDTALFLANVEFESGLAVDMLIGAGISVRAFTELQRLLSEGKVPADAIPRLERTIERRRPRVTLEQILEGERLYMIASAHQDNADDLDPVKRREREENAAEAEPLLNVVRMSTPASHAYDRFLPPGFKVVAMLRTIPESPHTDLDAIHWAMRTAARSWAQCEMQRDTARITLALERYRAARASYPAALTDLVPDFLSLLPTDALSGGEFGYKRFDQPDAAGRGFLLYSFNVDRRDDAGVESPTKKRDEGDVPLNEPRPPLTPLTP